jgi:putative ABC transport system permease protein
MINLAARDVLHGWGKFLFTGFGLGLLIGLTLSMAGIYRGLVDDGQALLAIGGADLWVVQRDTLGPYAEPSSVRDDAYRSLAGIPGVAAAGNVTYLTMQVRHGSDGVRVMLGGFEPGRPGVHGGQSRIQPAVRARRGSGESGGEPQRQLRSAAAPPGRRRG